MKLVSNKCSAHSINLFIPIGKKSTQSNFRWSERGGIFLSGWINMQHMLYTQTHPTCLGKHYTRLLECQFQSLA